ncbi:hypothetical protein DIPPA_11417 [Diplonema papillatum]|nr:hypothetical protein DIPPA_11417 [Diplonema papillatum]
MKLATHAVGILALVSNTLAVDHAFDCAVREYAFEYAQQLQGWRGADTMKEVFDGLELKTLCNQTFKADAFLDAKKVAAFPIQTELVHYVCPHFGSDDVETPGRGNEAAPFATIAAALESMRRLRSGKNKAANPATLVLRGGKHRLKRTLNFTSEDSFLTVQNYPGEEAGISGTIPLQPSWKREPTMSANVYSAYVGGLLDAGVTLLALRVNTTQRGFKATFPDRNPELSIFPKGWVPTSVNVSWTPPTPAKTQPVYVAVADPHLTDTTMFQNYVVGVNATCEVFTPPVSYWCSEVIQRGNDLRFKIPSGLAVPDSVGLKKYSNPKKAVIQAWRPSHWASWMWEVDEYDSATNNFTFGRGGFQSAQGDNIGAEWFIEDVFEELDSAQEYYYNDTTQMLYFVYNATLNTPPPPSLEFDAVVLETLVTLLGTQEDPVVGVHFQGLRIADAGPTYLTAGHGVPSGGDWALQRAGAIFMEGTQSCSLRENLVTKLDGNAVMISGYNRGLVIERNEFSWIGDSVLAAWGYTMPLNTTGNNSDSVLAQYKNGIDGTDGNQPLGTQVLFNYVHELGHFEKQSSFWFQAVTAQTNLTGNIAYNMPRAGINFNDGFGGDNTVTKNLLWNTCRESGDHANFNSWDRQPFLTTILNGTKSLIPQYNYIHHNFLIGNGGAVNTVDNDDGSAWYEIYSNFLVYGGHKSDFSGHDKISHDNINAMAKVYQDGLCVSDSTDNVPGHEDSYYNNRCVQDKDGLNVYQLVHCNSTDIPSSTSIVKMHNNSLYNPSGKATIQCGPAGSSPITLQQFQAAGFDNGTTIQLSPTTAQIIEWAKELLAM